MAFSKRSITHAILGLFQEAYKPAFHALALSWIVSWYFFSWETLYSAVLSLTNMLSLCQIMISRAPSAIPEHNIFCCSVVARILTPSLNVAFGLNRASKINVGLEPGSGSGRVQASKWGPFTTLCGYVCRGQQGENENIRLPPNNSKYRLKSFCEVGYANFRPNVFAAGKRISIEILAGVGLHARCPAALKHFVAFSKNRNVQEKYLSSL